MKTQTHITVLPIMQVQMFSILHFVKKLLRSKE